MSRPLRFALYALSGFALLVASRATGSAGKAVLAGETPSGHEAAPPHATGAQLTTPGSFSEAPAWAGMEAAIEEGEVRPEEARASELLETLLLPEAGGGAQGQRARWADARDLQDLLRIEAQLDAWRLRLLQSPRTIS